jgi:FkbH-like protein
MKNVSFIDARKSLEENKDVDLPKLRISILRNIVVEPFDIYLKYFVQEIGCCAEIEYGEYDQILQEVMQDNEKLFKNVDVVIVFLKLETLSWDISRNFPSLSREEVDQEVDRIDGYIQNVLAGIRRQTAAMILWHSFEIPVAPAYGIIDSCQTWGQTSAIRLLNNKLQECVSRENSSYLVDMNSCLARIGYEQFYDNRYWHISKAPYSRRAIQEIALENLKFLRSLKGKTKKCLVLDCDNTLWGGILGEDGLVNVKLGKSHPGSIYYELQQEILNLYHRGVILTLCSKNNERDVWEIFEKHPDMLLKKEHISAAMINWDDKATNIQRLAEDLNIGLDSMVFIDDSEFECDLIRQSLPEVEVVHFSDSIKLELRLSIISNGLFDFLTVTDEDRNRGALYRAEAARKNDHNSFHSLEDFYESLEMEVTIKKADEFSIPRIAQLTQKTNQFNLTTLRYSEAEIRHLSDSEEADVLFVQLKDKFGDYGIIGVSVVQYKKEQAIIDAFLLSCRALGRGVEDILLEKTMALARVHGCVEIMGTYSPTSKNMQVEKFYVRHQYESIFQSENRDESLYLSPLNNEILLPEYFRKIIFG